MGGRRGNKSRMGVKGRTRREYTPNQSRKCKPRVPCGSWTQCPLVVRAARCKEGKQCVLILGKVTSHSGLWKQKGSCLVFRRISGKLRAVPTPNLIYQHTTFQRGKE